MVRGEQGFKNQLTPNLVLISSAPGISVPKAKSVGSGVTLAV